MKTDDIKQELTAIEVWSGLIGSPPTHPYLALRLTTEGQSGEKTAHPWTALSPRLAQQLLELLQANLGHQTSAPPGQKH